MAFEARDEELNCKINSIVHCSNVMKVINNAEILLILGVIYYAVQGTSNIYAICCFANVKNFAAGHIESFFLFAKIYKYF
jgi:hypothetical protein